MRHLILLIAIAGCGSDPVIRGPEELCKTGREDICRWRDSTTIDLELERPLFPCALNEQQTPDVLYLLRPVERINEIRRQYGVPYGYSRKGYLVVYLQDPGGLQPTPGRECLCDRPDLWDSLLGLDFVNRRCFP
jgi:hypothetical protein